VNDVRDDAGAWLETLRRNSGLALDPEGRWRYGAGFVENERVAEMFHGGVVVRPDGEVTLTVGRMWAYVKCEGPARFVRGVRGRQLELLGGGALDLDTHSVAGWGPDDRLYLWVDEGGPLKVLRAPHMAFVAQLETQPPPEHDRLVLRCAGLEIPVITIAQVPGPRGAAPSS